MKYDNILSIFRRYIIFWFLEFGIISLITINKKNYRYIFGLLLILSIIPFFFIGNGADFVNRVSIPSLMFINILVIERFNNFKKYKISNFIIVLYLIISAVTPFQEFYRTINNTVFINKFDINKNRKDNWKTFSNFDNLEARNYFKNFVTKYDDDNFIFKYLLK